MNVMKLMKQAAAAQKNMEKVQGELAEKTVEFSSGGGMIKVTASGDGAVRAISIDPEALDPEDVGMLEDMVLAAVNGALNEVRDMASAEMAKVTQGLNLPGM